MRRLLTLFALLLALPAWAAVDLNSATPSELETLPGIGPSKAAAIVQYRADHGPFESVDELDNVTGIGPATLAALRDQVTVGKGDGKAAAAKAEAPESEPAPKSSGGGACPVNINKADAAGLMSMPGIGASKAAAIAQHRVDRGPFASCDALDDVTGIGPSTIANLRDCCTVK